METVSLVAISIAVAISVAVTLIVVRMIAARSPQPAQAPQAPTSSAAVPSPAAAPPAVPSTRIDVAPPYKLVQSRHGWMLVNPNDAYLGQAIVQYGECCEIEVAFLLQLLSLRAGVVMEVGTNIGTHTVPLAKALARQNRRLLAFEPQPVIFQNMCANLALNALGNVMAWPSACGDRAATLYFSQPDYAAGGNFGGVSMSAEPVANGVAIPCIELDEVFGGETVSLMKVDVEGFELLVLQGAEVIIDRCRPVLYVENDRPEKSSELIEWLWSKEYRLWWHTPPLFNPSNFFANPNDVYPRIVSINMLCLPREAEVPVNGLQEIVVNRHPLEGAPA
jgi:FkbM family methyltransferase